MKKTNTGFKKEYTAYTNADKSFILKDYADHVSNNRTFYTILEEILKSKSKPKVLEIGSGTGRNTCYLGKQFKQASITGLDILKESAKTGKKVAGILKCSKNVSFLAADAQKLPYKDKTFDLIFSQGTLEHFKDVSKIMEEQVRALKDDGTLVINVPQTFSYYTIKKHMKMARGAWGPGWETQYSYGDLKRLGEEHGLKLIDVAGQEYDTKLTEFVKVYNFLARTLLHKVLDKFARSKWNSLKKRFGHRFLVEIIAVYRKSRK